MTSRRLKQLLPVLLIAAVAATVRSDVRYSLFDEIIGKPWKDARAQLGYYAISMRNEPLAYGLVVLHPARNSKNVRLTAWAWCIRNDLIQRERIPAERLAFFTGEPEDKLTARLWIGVSKKFPGQDAKDATEWPLVIDPTSNGKRVCASSR